MITSERTHLVRGMAHKVHVGLVRVGVGVRVRVRVRVRGWG